RKELDGADRSMTARMLSGPTRFIPNCVFANAHRVVHFQRLDRRVARIGHVGMYRACPILAGRGSCASADGLVVRKRLTAIGVEAPDEQIVHGPLARCRNPRWKRRGKRAKERVYDPLRRFDISRCHRTSRTTLYERTRGSNN